jgi:hypothetical protein
VPRTKEPSEPPSPEARPPAIDPARICDPSVEVVDQKRHRFVRLGSELVPIGADAVGLHGSLVAGTAGDRALASTPWVGRSEENEVGVGNTERDADRAPQRPFPPRVHPTG